VTDPNQLAHWFPTTVDVDVRVGAAMSLDFPNGGPDEMKGEVTELEPPRLFAFLWGDELLRFELEPADGGRACRLRLTHFLPRSNEAARTAAGWHVCFDRLDQLVTTGAAEAPSSEPTEEWLELYERYIEAGMPSGAAVPGSWLWKHPLHRERRQS